ncbi:uncharacterized protein LOC124374099 [Homalodisca vitripennis]|uniref:uncharacterized protein LOC124374099 n=1 Tax=Homalodisca vitripennis TaxID=197043 RepID=UPI001EEB6029|nr:uncharacterized protein LOC124374099 [Homalodisca vitripennis]
MKELEKLILGGDDQSLGFFKTIISSLTSLKELWISIENPSPEAESVFRVCKGLVKLRMCGARKSHSFVRALISSLISLRELAITVQELTPELGDVLKECTRLKSLVIVGRLNDGFIWKVLRPPLADSLEELRILKSQDSQDLSFRDYHAKKNAEASSIDIYIGHG